METYGEVDLVVHSICRATSEYELAISSGNLTVASGRSTGERVNCSSNFGAIKKGSEGSENGDFSFGENTRKMKRLDSIKVLKSISSPKPHCGKGRIFVLGSSRFEGILSNVRSGQKLEGES